MPNEPTNWNCTLDLRFRLKICLAPLLHLVRLR